MNTLIEEFIRYTPVEFEYEYAKKCACICIKKQIENLMWLNLLCTNGNYMKKHLNDKVEELQKQLKEIEDEN